MTGTKASMLPPGAAAPARKRLNSGTPHLCTPKGLAKLGEVGEARCCQTYEASPDFTEYAGPPFQAGLRFLGVSLAASRNWSRAHGTFRALREPAPGSRGEQPGRR